MPENDPIEESLFGQPDDLSEFNGNLSLLPIEEIIDEIENREPLLEEVRAPAQGVDGVPFRNDKLGRFPGALQNKPDPSTGRMPPPDCYAFYLPWHYFRPQDWGIYLLVEGIEEFGRQIKSLASPHLPAAQARQAAKAFLFHHEAYHNAVEAFAARLEISHRKPCYKTGVESLNKNWYDKRKRHEEGLADAYALEKTGKGIYSELPGPLRTRQRKIAYAALLRLIEFWPPKYACAMEMLKQERKFDAAIQSFQEEAHAASKLGSKRLKPVIWRSSLYAMAPSLQRNKSFSYLIKRSHPAIKLKLDARYISVPRRDFLRKLEKHAPGYLVAGGRHAKWKTKDGQKVPVPNHRELNEYTAGAILKQLGLNMRIRDFMES